MKIVLSSNPYRDHSLETALEAQRILKKEGAVTVICLPFLPQKGDHIEIPHGVAISSIEKEICDADLLICFGGDGTILHAARDAAFHNVPIIGVNMGSMGFMAELERGELPLLAELVTKPFETEKRMMLDVRTFRGEKLIKQELALNDAVISKGSMARVGDMIVMADDVQIGELHGDGVIVATPTGSTAYSLSAGGPIIEPTMCSLLVTPVCCHTLSPRATVLAPDRMVTVRLPKGNRKSLYLSVDGGKALKLTGGDHVEICRSQYCTRLVKLLDRSFCQVINQKFGGYVP